MNSLALVLSGGAARGAYAAGVMRYLFRELPRHLGRVPWPDIVTGSSVGALNGVFAAARTLDGIDRVTQIWRDMTIGDVYKLETGGLIRSLRATWAAASGASLLDAAPLYELVDKLAPLPELRQAIDSHALQSFIVSATQVDTGINVLFVDSAMQRLGLDPLPMARVSRVHITGRHLLASAALPFAFHPVEIDGVWYVDGGLRQNTPLRPAVMAGAGRAIVIGTTADREYPAGVRHPELTPNIPFLAGKTLNALLADPVERDLRTTNQINAIVEWGVSVYGPDFARRMEAELGMRRVHTLFIRPSEDLGCLAAESWHKRQPRVPRQIAWLLSTIADRANASDGESDLLSYLLFDRGFTAVAEEIGYQDARRQAEDLARFVDAAMDAPQPPMTSTLSA